MENKVIENVEFIMKYLNEDSINKRFNDQD